MSAEDFEPLKAIAAEDRQRRSEAGEQRRNQNAHVFAEAAELAEANGLYLVRHSWQHYQLSAVDAHWLLNLYPGNQRLYWTEGRKGPFLTVPRPWTLLDVVNAAIERMAKDQAKGR